MGLSIHTSDNQYDISDAIQDFISFELPSFGLGEDLGFICEDKDKPLIDTCKN